MSANVGRLSEVEDGPITGYFADIRIHCDQCGQAFQFIGLPPGQSSEKPTVSIDATEARMPLCEAGSRPSPLDLMGSALARKH
ncbi:MAG: hypothetical protein ABW128_06980 [Rhizorhabdus sp.]